VTSALEQKSGSATLGLQGVRTRGQLGLSRQATMRLVAARDAEWGVSIRLIASAVNGA
jgi:hypothetical protein